MDDATNPGEVRLAFPAISVISGSSAMVADDPALLRLNNAHAEELSVLHHETLGRVVHDDLNALLFGIIQLPGRSFEKTARAAGHDFH